MQTWDTQMGESNGPREEYQQDATCAIYSPDGRFIASGSLGEVIVWDTQRGLVSGEPLRRSSNTWARSVAYSPDGRFLASGANDGKIYVHHAPNDRDDVEARWLNSCSHMDLQDGWIKDGETLLLWIPAPYREHLPSCVRVIIPNPTPNFTAYNVDYQTLFRYSGRNWVDILSGFDE